MRRYLALALSFLMVSGCSTYSYSGRPVTVPKIEAMPVWRTEGPVTVGVDPYIQPDRQKEVFDDDLEKAGALPIYLLIKNNGERPLSLRYSDIKLELSDGSLIHSVGSEWVLRMLGKWPQSVPCSIDCLPRDAAPFLPLLPVIIPLLLPVGLASKSASEARIADYKEKDFKDIKLGKGDSTHGFVFMPTSASNLKGKLLLRFEDTDGSSFVIRVPVSEQ